MEKQILFNVSHTTLFRIVSVVILLAGVVFLKDLLVLIFVAWIIASGVYITAESLHTKYNLPKTLSITGMFVLFLGALVGLMFVLVPLVMNESYEVIQSFPTILIKIESLWESWSGQQESLVDFFQKNANLQQYMSNVTTGFFFTTRGLASLISYVFLVFVLSLYIAMDTQGLDKTILHYTPKAKRAYMKVWLVQAREKLGAWFIGQLCIAIILGGLSYLALAMVGIKYAVLLAVAAGILNMIPFLGPTLSAIPAVFFGLLQGWQVGVYVLIAYIFIQQVDGNFLTPMVMNKVTGFNPAVVIVAILIGASLAGALGAVVALPVLSLVTLTLEMNYTFKENL
jgi:predicted PurR-regulated permease PerM